MGVESMIPRIWSDLTVEKLQNALVFGGLANTGYEGEITGYGDSVTISTVGHPTVSDYTGADFTWEDVDAAARVLKIDKAKYATQLLGDVEAAQIKPKIVNQITQNLAYSLADSVDADVAKLYTDAGIVDGSTGTVTEVDSSDVLEYVFNIGTKMNENNVPSQGRVLVVPPWFVEKMQLAKVTLDTDNSAALATGFVGSFGGFQIYWSNNVANSGTSWWAPMAFRAGDGIALAQQLVSMETTRTEKNFKTGVKSLVVYGCKVIRPEAVYAGFCKPGAEG